MNPFIESITIAPIRVRAHGLSTKKKMSLLPPTKLTLPESPLDTSKWCERGHPHGEPVKKKKSFVGGERSSQGFLIWPRNTQAA